jgi:hypothetical protein
MTVTPLSRPPEQDELWALIEEARRRARRRRRRYGLAFVLVCLGGAAVYALLARSVGRPASVIGAPRGPAPPSAASGPVWYTRTVRLMHESLPAGGITLSRRGFTRRHGPAVRFDLRVSEETWEQVDGTIRDRTVVAAVRFRSRADRAKWRAYGRPVPNFNMVWLGWISHDGIDVAGGTFPPQPGYQAGEWMGPSGKDVADSLFTYSQLLALPSGPVALRARLREAETALTRRQGSLGGPTAPVRPPPAVFELIDVGSLLAAPIPASLRHALFAAVITMPGALVNRHAHDALGRPGIAVSASNGAAFQRLIFDPASGALLENAPDVAVTAQGAVSSVYALPRGVSPVHAAGAPPKPQVPTISPATGQRATVFTVTLSPSRQQRPRRPPALDWLLIGTPGPRCFATFAAQLPPLTAAGSVTRPGRLSYAYRLTPADVHRRTWCPGRYQLLVVPADPRHPNAAYLGMVRNIGSSITFQVR